MQIFNLPYIAIRFFSCSRSVKMMQAFKILIAPVWHENFPRTYGPNKLGNRTLRSDMKIFPYPSEWCFPHPTTSSALPSNLLLYSCCRSSLLLLPQQLCSYPCKCRWQVQNGGSVSLASACILYVSTTDCLTYLDAVEDGVRQRWQRPPTDALLGLDAHAVEHDLHLLRRLSPHPARPWPWESSVTSSYLALFRKMHGHHSTIAWRP